MLKKSVLVMSVCGIAVTLGLGVEAGSEGDENEQRVGPSLGVAQKNAPFELSKDKETATAFNSSKTETVVDRRRVGVAAVVATKKRMIQPTLVNFCPSLKAAIDRSTARKKEADAREKKEAREEREKRFAKIREDIQARFGAHK